MSFASRAREEIAQRSLQKDCCVRAAAYGFACFAKYFDKGGLVLQTEQPHTVQLARELFARCGVQGDVLEKQRPSGVLYEFNIREPEQVARMHELFGTTGSETSLQSDPALIRCQTCVSAYIGAAFLCSGTVTDPQKEYNLEFLTARPNLARDFDALRQRRSMHRKPSSRSATRPIDRPTATRPTLAKRPGPTPRPSGPSGICRKTMHWKHCRRCCSRRQQYGCNTPTYRLPRCAAALPRRRANPALRTG